MYDASSQLDANVAGYASVASPNSVYKSNLSSADLTALDSAITARSAERRQPQYPPSATYYTHFTRSLNAPSWSPLRDAADDGGAYADASNEPGDTAEAARSPRLFVPTQLRVY